MRTAGAVLITLLALAGCGSDGTADDATRTSTTTTSTTVDATASWSRPCHDSSGGPKGSDAGSTTFGPLGAEPSVVVHLPTASRPTTTDTAHPQDAYPSVSWGRVDGAIVVSAAPPFTSGADTSLVTAIDDDGSVRWTRCLTGTVVGVGSGDDAPSVAVVIRRAAGSDPVATGDLLLLDATDGHEEHRIRGVNQLLAASGDQVLVGRVDPDGSGPKDVRLVDLGTGGREPVAHPPVAVDPPQFELIAGRLTVEGDVWHDGAWVPDTHPAVVVDFDFSSDPSTLVRRRGNTIEWQLPRQHPGLEGPAITRDDRTAVAWACDGARGADGHCPLALVGVDVASGHELWTRPGEQFLGVGGDDAFLAAEDGVWTMRRMRTGTPIAGQRWADRDAFLQGCCGDYEFHRVERFGGTVLVLDDTEVRVWFPKAHSHPTVDVQP